MKQTIQSTRELGWVLRAVRKSSHVRQDDLAALVGVSKQFAVDVEAGKPTVQFGRVLRLLDELGIVLSVDLTPEAMGEFKALRDRASAPAGQAS